MILNFRKILREGVVARLQSYNLDIGTYDYRLRALTETEALPFVVVYVRQMTPAGQQICVPTFQKLWEVHIYYLDKAPTWEQGEDRMDTTVGSIIKSIANDYTLGQLQATDVDGSKEYVISTDLTSVLFDSSGQEGDYSFVSEVYLNVLTDS